MRHGIVNVAVLAGFEVYVGYSDVPWEVGAPNDAAVAMYDLAILDRVNTPRVEARRAGSQSGVFFGERNQKVMSVSLSDHCEHPEDIWQKGFVGMHGVSGVGAMWIQEPELRCTARD